MISFIHCGVRESGNKLSDARKEVANYMGA